MSGIFKCWEFVREFMDYVSELRYKIQKQIVQLQL